MGGFASTARTVSGDMALFMAAADFVMTAGVMARAWGFRSRAFTFGFAANIAMLGWTVLMALFGHVHLAAAAVSGLVVLLGWAVIATVPIDAAASDA